MKYSVNTRIKYVDLPKEKEAAFDESMRILVEWIREAANKESENEKKNNSGFSADLQHGL